MRITFCLSLLLACATWLAAPASAADKVVPDVVGLALEPARQLMEQAGCTVEVRYEQGPPAGFVFSQTPGGLTPLRGATGVVLAVGGDTPKPSTTPVPDVPEAPPSGSPGPGSGDDLPPTGLPPGDTELPGAGEPTAPVPTTTTPEPGPGEAPPVAAGDIPAEREPDTAGPELPSVLGQLEAGARRTLSAWRVRVEQSPGVPTLVGQVINQSPFPGRTLAAGEEVTIVVAVASAPDRSWRIAPKATSLSMDAAVRTVEAAGFRAELRSVASSPDDVGRVLTQIPLPGSLQQLGQAVVLRVGRGSRASLASPGGSTPVVPTQPDPAPTQPSGDTPDAPPSGAGTSPLEAPVAPTQPGAPTEAPLPDTTPPSQPQPPPQQPEPVPTEQPARNTVRLGATRLVSPPPGESYPWRYGADFEWTQVQGATSYEWELEEELPSGAWKASDAQTFTTPTFRPKTLPRGRYRWRVRAAAGEDKGEWSAWQRLYMY